MKKRGCSRDWGSSGRVPRTPRLSTLHNVRVVDKSHTYIMYSAEGPWTHDVAGEEREGPRGASGRPTRAPCECGGAPSRLTGTRCPTPALILRPAAPRYKSFPRRVGDASRSPCRVLGAQVQPVIAWGACLRGRQARHSHDGRGAHQEEEQAGRRRGADAPRSSAADTATRCAGRPRAAVLAARPRAHRPLARPLRGRVPCAPSRPSSSWPTCTRCPWKTPTSTQRLPCSPPSLPPGCSMPDGLLDG